jgi:hypothetical protein
MRLHLCAEGNVNLPAKFTKYMKISEDLLAGVFIACSSRFSAVALHNG